MKRRLLILIFATSLAVPALALADASSDGLGPTTTGSGASSSADGTALQPAGTSTLQSGTTDSSGLSAGSDAANSLQQPASTDPDALKVMLNDNADGVARDAKAAHSAWYYAVWFILILVILSLIFAVWRRAQMMKLAGQLNDEVGSAEATRSAETINENPGESTETVAEALPSETSENVQSDETAPQKLVTSDEKVGDDSGKVASKGHKKGKKHRPKHK